MEPRFLAPETNGCTTWIEVYLAEFYFWTLNSFDTVDHHILLSKLKLYGIRGNSVNWFNSYLKGRNQIWSVNDKMSSVREIGCGEPQGSNLGPIQFLLYINDLPNCLESTKANLFAHDT